MGVSRKKLNKNLFPTLSPFQLAKIWFQEKIKGGLASPPASLLKSYNLNSSTNELLIKLYKPEKNKINNNIFHHRLAGVGGLNLERIIDFLSKCEIIIPKLTLIKIL